MSYQAQVTVWSAFTRREGDVSLRGETCDCLLDIPIEVENHEGALIELKAFVADIPGANSGIVRIHAYPDKFHSVATVGSGNPSHPPSFKPSR